jgi:ABC-type branched-subunit amino acid transport system substrate-binding protein
MFRPNLAWRTLAVLGVAALTLGACADGDNGDDPDGPGTGDAFEGVLKLGAILPETGSLAFLGEPMFTGFEMAIEDINAAGGVWGNPVEALLRDEGDSAETEVAAAAADFLISQEVHAIVGAAATGSSLAIIEALYNQQIIMVSPSNTGPVFTTHEHGQYYFRTAPSDVMQGSALAQEIIEDGHETTAILAMQNAYGEGLADQVDAVYSAGGGTVAEKIFFEPNTSEFAAEVSALVAAGADSLVIVSYEEVKQIVPALVEGGLGPDQVQWYFVDGNLTDYSADFDAGLLEGVKGTAPGPESPPQDFYDRMAEFRPGIDTFIYGPEAYDAAIAIALAAIAANSDDGDAIAAQLPLVTSGGTVCTTFADCKDMLEAGEDINYDGITGPIDWTPAGDPGAAFIGIFEYAADNTISRIKTVAGSM